jgi:two-component system LytT family sensor kinase
MNPQGYLVSLLVKLAVMAAVASVVARSNTFKSMLMHEGRTLRQRLTLALWLAVIFAFGVAVRVARPPYEAADLGLEGSLVAGLLGGYVTGLLSGILIAIPAFFHQEYLTLPLLAGIGVLGGLLRDLAPTPEEVWRFSPFPDLNIYRFLKEKHKHWHTGFQLIFFSAILCAEALRQAMGSLFNSARRELVFCLAPPGAEPFHSLAIPAIYGTTLFAVAIPLKIWNNARNEKKLEEQERLLVEARLTALTSQINPHFLFNTLNSVSSLIRTDPNQARVMVVKLSKVLRKLLRKHENFSPLRDELNFIEDYLSIEVIRFGDKLRFETDVADDTLDMLVPSMMLQPLVENSIKHGLSTKVDGGTIRIRTRRTENRLHLQVEDDGVGISEDKLATLLDHGGIGVSNVNERLKVLFGTEYRMWIESRPGNGTRVQIEVPELQTTLAAVS